jgi:hypothetical protein
MSYSRGVHEMAVTHVLKDGTVLNDITGHVVKMTDVPSVYALVDQINRKRGGKNGGIDLQGIFRTER